MKKNNQSSIIPNHTIIQSYNLTQETRVVWLYRWTKFFLEKIVCPLIILTLLSACEKGPAIPENEFIKVYVDLLILQDTTGVNTSVFDSLKTSVFKNHGVSAKEYDATINYYNSNPKKWEEFFNKAIAYAEKLKSETKK